MEVLGDWNGSKLVVAPPSLLIGRGKSLPERRWHKKSKSWLVPATARSISAVQEAYPEIMWSKEAAKVIAQVLARESQRQSGYEQMTPIPAGYRFEREPWDHQRKALEQIHMIPTPAVFAEMRTGKTKIAVDWASINFGRGELDRVLVVCPMSITETVWKKTIHIDCPMTESVHVVDLGRYKSSLAWIDDHERCSTMSWMILALESVSGSKRAEELADTFLTGGRGAIVVDESHQIANHQANRTKTLIELGHLVNYRMIMTGTETRKSLEDLFAQFKFLDEGIIGFRDWWSFRNHYCVMGGYEKREIYGYDNVPELMDKIAPVTVRIERKDIKDQPPKLFERRSVKPSKEQLKAIARVKKAILEQTTVKNVLTEMLRLHQIAGGFEAYENPDLGSKIKYLTKPIPGRNPKAAELATMLKELGNIQVIIWARFKPEVVMLAEILENAGETVAQLHGDIKKGALRDAEIERFQSGKARFLVANQATGGVGLDFKNADAHVFFSNTFSYVERIQAEDRTEDLDRETSTLYIDLTMEYRGSVDDLIMQALSEKKDLADLVKEAMRDRERFRRMIGG